VWKEERNDEKANFVFGQYKRQNFKNKQKGTTYFSQATTNESKKKKNGVSRGVFFFFF